MDQEHSQNALDEARIVIDEVDRAMAGLFARRMEAVAQVAAYKSEQGLPIYDAGREAIVLERNGALVDEEIRPYYLRFMEATMKESRRYQRELVQGEGKEVNGHGMD